MNLSEVKKAIAASESRFVEYKQSMAELDKLGKTICGFLNVQGGVGFLGISDKKKLVGVEVTDSTKKKLSAFCNYFDPWADLKIDYVPLPDVDRQIIAIHAQVKANKIPFIPITIHS